MSPFLGLCYHYIRPTKSEDSFPRLLGTRRPGFEAHLDALGERYRFIGLPEVSGIYSERTPGGDDRPGMLLTFDDGLSDHHLAAGTLAERGIPGVFFLPTCILQDKEPANPTIIHYALADAGIPEFLELFNPLLEDHLNEPVSYQVEFSLGKDDPWATIDRIKQVVNYELDPSTARRILLTIYEELLLSKYPDALERMHLTEGQVQDILEMGHTIGTHSRTHISVGTADVPDERLLDELVGPKRYLESTFEVEVDAMSYPFGGEEDCLHAEELLARTDAYSLAFTVEEKMNRPGTRPLELGRYMPHSTDDAQTLVKKLEAIENAGRQPA